MIQVENNVQMGLEIQESLRLWKYQKLVVASSN
jgi:hypothetical protein